MPTVLKRHTIGFHRHDALATKHDRPLMTDPASSLQDLMRVVLPQFPQVETWGYFPLCLRHAFEIGQFVRSKILV